MALIKCRECGNAVSTAASVCPKCGAPVVVTPASSGVAAPAPYVPFWIPSRIVGAVLCALGFMALLFAILHTDSMESQLRRGFNQEDLTLLIALGVGGVSLLIGIPLFAGVMRLLNTTGQIIFIVILLSVFVGGPLLLLVVWVPFVIPKLKASYSKP